MVRFFAIIAVQSLALHVLFIEMERRWPPRPFVSALSEEERARRATSMNRLGSTIGSLLWPIVTVGWFVLFRWIEWCCGPNLPGARFVLRSQMGYAFLSPIFAGIALTGPVAVGMVRLIRWRSYHVDMACGDHRYGFDARRLFYLFIVWIIPLCVDWEFAFINSWTVVTDDAIVARDLMRVSPVTHKLSDVTHIHGVRVFSEIPGAMAPKPSFKVTFRDGRVWTNAMCAHFPLPDDRVVIDFIARRSGRPIEWVNEIP